MDKILVVDDEVSCVKALEDVLNYGGYSVVSTADPRKVAEFAESEHPDLILIEKSMWPVDGSELCRRLRQSPGTKDIPIILLIDIPEDREGVVTGQEPDADDYIRRPFDVDDLLARIKHCVAAGQHRDLIRSQTGSLRFEAPPEFLEEDESDRSSSVGARQSRVGPTEETNQDAGSDRVGLVPRSVPEAVRLQTQPDNETIVSWAGFLAAGISHEVRNVLSTISSTAFYLKEAAKGGDTTTVEQIDLLNSEILRAKRMISNLLDLSRSAYQTTERLDVTELLEQTVPLIVRRSRLRNIEVVANFAPVPACLADMDELRSCFLNLLNNGVDAMADGGRLTIETSSPRRDTIGITFRDTGCGIPEENLPKIFDPFFTWGKPRGKGTGLGLALTRLFVEKAGGTVEVESEEGKGTAFTITLPAQQ